MPPADAITVTPGSTTPVLSRTMPDRTVVPNSTLRVALLSSSAGVSTVGGGATAAAGGAGGVTPRASWVRCAGTPGVGGTTLGVCTIGAVLRALAAGAGGCGAGVEAAGSYGGGSGRGPGGPPQPSL